MIKKFNNNTIYEKYKDKVNDGDIVFIGDTKLIIFNSLNYSEYLPLTGGTISGSIERSSYGSYASAESNAIIKNNYAPDNLTYSVWKPIAYMKTYKGAYSLGCYQSAATNNRDDTFTLVHHNSSEVRDYEVNFPLKNGTLALTSSTLSGYGITDAYTKSLIDDKFYEIGEYIITKLIHLLNEDEDAGLYIYNKDGDGVEITKSKVDSWDNTTSNLNSILGSNKDLIINKWDEIVDFLATYTEADTLANLLSNKFDKAGGVVSGSIDAGNYSITAYRGNFTYISDSETPESSYWINFSKYSGGGRKTTISGDLNILGETYTSTLYNSGGIRSLAENNVLTLEGDVNITGYGNGTGKLSVAGNVSITGSITASSTAYLNSNLQVLGEVNLKGEYTKTGNLWLYYGNRLTLNGDEANDHLAINYDCYSSTLKGSVNKGTKIYDGMYNKLASFEKDGLNFYKTSTFADKVIADRILTSGYIICGGSLSCEGDFENKGSFATGAINMKYGNLLNVQNYDHMVINFSCGQNVMTRICDGLYNSIADFTSSNILFNLPLSLSKINSTDLTITAANTFKLISGLDNIEISNNEINYEDIYSVSESYTTRVILSDSIAVNNITSNLFTVTKKSSAYTLTPSKKIEFLNLMAPISYVNNTSSSNRLEISINLYIYIDDILVYSNTNSASILQSSNFELTIPCSYSYINKSSSSKKVEVQVILTSTAIGIYSLSIPLDQLANIRTISLKSNKTILGQSSLAIVKDSNNYFIAAYSEENGFIIDCKSGGSQKLYIDKNS